MTANTDIVRGIFADVLKCADVSGSDNFFALGGDSLKAVQVINRASAELGVQLSVVDLFQNPSAAALDLFVANSVSAQASAVDADADTQTPGANELDELLDELEGLDDDAINALLS